MGIVFNKGGLYTTVQDYGRMGYQSSGFHVCGVMDRHSYWIANLLLDNKDTDAVLEFTVCGPTFYFTEDAVISITGGDFDPKINGEKIPMYHAVEVKMGDELEMGFCKSGTWGYIAFAGGLDVPLVMGSRSTDVKCGIGGINGRKIKDGDKIDFINSVKKLPNMKERFVEAPDYSEEVVNIRVTMGPQDDYFTQDGIDTFLSNEYSVTHEIDRMGYRLDGPEIEHNEKGADIVSDGIAKGAIQVPHHGKPIVLLSDRQTTGGYTKIANVISVDISKLVQCKYPQKVKFTAVSVEEAQNIYLMERQRLQLLNKRFLKKRLIRRLVARWKN